ncbi:lipid IV(A) 3-deoxy-D-manno-octulosonic acid transferase [Candidatus Erwinia haradaeae]|uniref:3-deoxy-D-manno-octulosonic acid transferase n=1 Tax=Candidatus Erwinia haradaeae TaxID=1922217 RepID=A0A451D1W7_9GAMM|nr:lipid IV(A) 3-deoxy-D-manno-octulosonic acid transferase [Candidatus Erwinia haradaeae]VFP79603.1 3-deoxy-D-manno-octulosonic acid transferase [Candidatus Erwinia haradaeae]
MLILYTMFFYILQPVIWIRLWFRGRKVVSYRKRWAERYGFCTGKVHKNGILLHAVSLGETIAAIPLIQELKNRYPHLPIVITTMTPTGSAFAKSEFGSTVSHVYLPYDLPRAMNRFLNTIKPILVIIMERELWPNMITILHNRKIPLIIANARLSERSAKNYQLFGRCIKILLQRISLIAAQSQEDSQHFIKLGAKNSQIVVTGNLKFDINISPKIIENAIQLRLQWIRKNRPIWIAASTHRGEEKIILSAHCKLLKNFPDLLLILAPRHPERSNIISRLVQKKQLKYLLRSSKEIPTVKTQVIIEDTTGKLMLLYAVSDLAFIGGSLVKIGGHNPLEPAAHAIPILMGSHTFNFKDICNSLHHSNGLITITNTESLYKEITTLLTDSNYRLHCGQQALHVFNKNKGALERLLNAIEPYFPKRQIK